MNQQEQAWRKSSRCESGACVEVAVMGHAVVIRDSKDLHGPMLTIDRGAWTEFIEGIRAGEF